MTAPHECSVSQLRRLGFESRCADCDGARYLWHDGCGLRVDPDSLAVTLITDAARLPEGPWVPTELGQRELAEGPEG